MVDRIDKCSGKHLKHCRWSCTLVQYSGGNPWLSGILKLCAHIHSTSKSFYVGNRMWIKKVAMKTLTIVLLKIESAWSTEIKKLRIWYLDHWAKIQILALLLLTEILYILLFNFHVCKIMLIIIEPVSWGGCEYLTNTSRHLKRAY